MRKLVLLCSTLLMALITPAQAGPPDEVRFGVVYHNIRTDHGDLAQPKEDGPNVEGEMVWSSPHWLHWLGAPRPYVMASINTQGNTSFASTGVYWRIGFLHNWAFEPGFGIAVHDGELDIPRTLGRDNPASTAFEAQHQLLGSRVLFRESFALEHNITDHTAWQAYYEHLSNGQVFHHGRNQGLDEAGLRLLFRFNTDPAH